MINKHVFLEKVFDRFNQLDPSPNRPPEKATQGSEFKSLVSVMLSAQTQDSRTKAASDQLFSVADTPETILKLSDDELEKLIRPVGMYKRKTKLLKKLCSHIISHHKGTVPNTRIELLKIPGIGRKSTDIMMRFVFGEDAIAVDTHVRRLCYRLGLSTKNDADTIAKILELNTPEKYKWGAHEWLIMHGKYICSSRKPKCDNCFLSDLCKKVDV